MKATNIKYESTIILIFFMYIYPTNAQTYFGLHTGATITHFKLKEEKESYTNDWVKGANSGLHFDFGINKKLSIRPGLDFYQKGYVRRSRFFYRITYLDLSVLMKFKAIELKYNKKGKKIGIYGLLGPYVGLGLYGRLKDKKEGNSKKHELSTEEKRNIGSLVGAGVNLPTKKGLYFFDISYNYCVSEVVGVSDSYGYRGFVAKIGHAWKL